VKDGMPWLPLHLGQFDKLKCDWTYHLVHGAAANTGSTKWCALQPAGLSADGSTEFIKSISSHPNVRVYENQWWSGGKDAMFRTAIAKIPRPCVLFMPDVDEIFTAAQIEKIVGIFNDFPQATRMYFYCRYFLGRNILATSTNGCGNKDGHEWLRAVRWDRYSTFDAHEPVIVSGNKGYYVHRDDTKQLGLVFDHFSWVLDSTVRQKCDFYNYRHGYERWKRLQQRDKWPLKNLSDYLPWVGQNASADLFSNVCPNEENPLDKILKP